MSPLSPLCSNCIVFASTLLMLVLDAVRFLRLCLRSPTTLAAENLFLRKQLALYQERNIRPRRATNTTRLTLVWLGRWFDWRQALAIVQPTTFLRWHRLPPHRRVVARPVLSGLHHTYGLEDKVA